jgi:hypothetical protein
VRLFGVIGSSAGTMVLDVLETPVRAIKTASGQNMKPTIAHSLNDTWQLKDKDEAECATDSGARSPGWTAESTKFHTCDASWLKQEAAEGPSHCRMRRSRAANPNTQVLDIYRTNYSVCTEPTCLFCPTFRLLLLTGEPLGRSLLSKQLLFQIAPLLALTGIRAPSR